MIHLSMRIRVIIAAIVVIYTVFFLGQSVFSNRFIAQFKRFPNKFYLPTTSHNTWLDLKATKCNSQRDIKNLRDELAYNFPYVSSVPIPRQIWQTWKTTPGAPDFPASFRNPQSEWVQNSELDGFSYSLIPDDHILPLLQNLYAEVPAVIEAYNVLPTNILKADFFRYLILYARGGIYSDMDTSPLKSLKLWPSLDPEYLNLIKTVNRAHWIHYKHMKAIAPRTPDENGNDEPGLVIGIEADPDRDDWKKWYARRIQFCQWTIQAKPGHPVLREIILNITATTLNSVKSASKHYAIEKHNSKDYNVNYRDQRGDDKAYKHDVLKSKNNIDGTDIMNWTGPGLFTDIVFEYINNVLHFDDNIKILNTNLAVHPNDAEDENKLTKSIKIFYKKISESLQAYNTIPWQFFAFITKPVIIDDIMVLPITCFSPGVGQMEAKSENDEMALVLHMFSGSWKKEADGNGKDIPQ